MNITLLPDLATFAAIVEQGSFSAVARSGGVTPSAVSRCVSRLEQEMGCKLLHRTTRKLALTETGRTVYEHALDMLDAARQAMDTGSSLQSIAQGRLTLSVPKAVGRFVIHPLMPEFLTRYPQIDVCLRLEDRYMDLIDDGVDMALRITNAPSPGLYGRALMPVSHIICATREYLRDAGVPEQPQDLRHHSCISLGETPADARWKFASGDKTETVQTRGTLCGKPYRRAAGRHQASPGDRQSAAVYGAGGSAAGGNRSGSSAVGVYQHLFRPALAALDAQQAHAGPNAGND
ncbi:D-malate degradation protein R [Pluralibacter gergoviae]|nr:D-malate degradation protein R [Pluralibacter gergoviae]